MPPSDPAASTLLIADWDGHVYRIPRPLLCAGLASRGDADTLAVADGDGTVYALPRALLTSFRVTAVPETTIAAPPPERRSLLACSGRQLCRLLRT